MNECIAHQDGTEAALRAARQICARKKTRLTPQRLQVLQLIWQSHKPLGAYDLIDALAKLSGRPVAPPTVYRALEFLLQMGLIHRIHSLNAFIGCAHPTSPGTEPAQLHYFLICNKCRSVQEIIQQQLTQQLTALTQAQGFALQQQWLEINGLCEHCR
ncbi:MAG: transcriptional repressor [Cellvibrionaceae bacterium]|nr:transcriptional repressor [Cellvibrionaceae bacterium]